MAYIPSLEKLQIGIEAAYGDEAVDTIEPAGITEFSLTPKVETVRIASKRADTMPAWDNFVTKRWAEGTVGGYVDYEAFNHILDAMFGYDAGTPFTYLSQLDWGTAEKSMSFRYGQTGALYLVGGVLPTSLRVFGDSNSAIQWSMPFFGTDVSDAATFAAVTADSPDWCLGHHGSIYIDEGVGATIGTTVLADTMFSFDWNVTSNKAPVWHMGDQKPDSYRNGKWGGSLKLVLEGTATTLGHMGDIIDATYVQKTYNVRLTFTDTANTLELDFCGVCESQPVVSTDLDGVVTVEMTLVPIYNTAYAGCCGADLIIA